MLRALALSALVAAPALSFADDKPAFFFKPNDRVVFLGDSITEQYQYSTYDPPFALAHHPIEAESSYVLAGHIHPCATLVGTARQRERLPCFWFGARIGVLPAFGEFTGCASIQPADGDAVWAVAEDCVIPITMP